MKLTLRVVILCGAFGWLPVYAEEIDSSASEVAGSGLHGDFDGDGDFDRYDFTALQICLSVGGPALLVPPACQVFNADGDQDVDLFDVGLFANLYTGPLRTVLVEAGGLVPIFAGPDAYYSGEPGQTGNNALVGIAAQAGFSQDDLWYSWSLDSAPEGTGEVIFHNAARPTTAFTILAPLLPGDYVFRLTVTNLITTEGGTDTVSLVVSGCDDDGNCDDGLFCNGVETCEPDGGCGSGANPCLEGHVCNETTDECIPNCEVAADCDDAYPCTNDTCVDGNCRNILIVCDDGLNCTIDSCDLATGVCVNADDCPVCQICDPATETCIAGGVSDELEFTLGVDHLTGTPCDDVVVAPLVFVPNIGASVPTLQSGDSADGGDGTDIMTAVFNFTGATTVVPTLTGIERVTITDFGTAAMTLQGTNITGLTTLNTLTSTNTNALVANNLAAVVDAGITNNAAGLRLSYVPAATSGNADDMTLTLSHVMGGTLTLTSATSNGIETMNIISTGAANTLAAITQMTGTTLATINKSGDRSLTVTAALPATVSTVNASTDTGGISVDVSGNIGNLTLTAGSGNDTFIVGANYTTADIINGGGGTDTLGLTSTTAAVVAAQANVTNMEALTISDGLAASVIANRFGPIATVNLQSGFTGAVPLTVVASSSVNLGARAASNDSTAHGTVDIPGLGTADTLTFAINDSDTNRAYIFTGVETLNLSSNHRGDGNAADGAANTIDGALIMAPTFGTGTINLNGPASLTIIGAVTAGTLTATTFTGNLILSTASPSAIAISSGSGNDALFGSAAGDALSGGTGTNIFEGLSGVDALTLGSGRDTIRILNAGANGVDRKLVFGFTAGSGGDVLNIDGDGLAILDGWDNFNTASSIQTHGSAGDLTVAAVSEIVRIIDGIVPNLTQANSRNGTDLLTAIGGTITVDAAGNEHLFLVADASGNTGVYYGDAGADTAITADELTLVAVLQGTTLTNLVFSNFSNAN